MLGFRGQMRVTESKTGIIPTTSDLRPIPPRPNLTARRSPWCRSKTLTSALTSIDCSPPTAVTKVFDPVCLTDVHRPFHSQHICAVNLLSTARYERGAEQTAL